MQGIVPLKSPRADLQAITSTMAVSSKIFAQCSKSENADADGI